MRDDVVYLRIVFGQLHQARRVFLIVMLLFTSELGEGGFLFLLELFQLLVELLEGFTLDVDLVDIRNFIEVGWKQAQEVDLLRSMWLIAVLILGRELEIV